jgi:site-specific recombinase XerD
MAGAAAERRAFRVRLAAETGVPVGLRWDSHGAGWRWHLIWTDGPSDRTMAALADRIARDFTHVDPTALVFQRSLRPTTVALAVVRNVRLGEPPFGDTSYAWAFTERLKTVDYPERGAVEDVAAAAVLDRLTHSVTADLPALIRRHGLDGLRAQAAATTPPGTPLVTSPPMPAAVAVPRRRRPPVRKSTPQRPPVPDPPSDRVSPPPLPDPAPAATPAPSAVPVGETPRADQLVSVPAGRAANTIRGYRSDWADFTTWCDTRQAPALPAAPAAVSGYLTHLAGRGMKVATISRRLTAIRSAHRRAALPDPTGDPGVTAVWAAIRRDHRQPAGRAAPLMPPLLWDVLAGCPDTRTWKNRNRGDEPDLAGARDRAILLVGFVAALRRSEIAALNVDDISEHPQGLVIRLPRLNPDRPDDPGDLVVLPRADNPRHCPVLGLQHWLDLAQIADGPVFRAVSKGNRALPRRLTPAAVNTLVQAAVARTGLDNPQRYSAHSLRAGFVTYAHTHGSTDRAITHQTRHRSLPRTGPAIHTGTWDDAWDDNAATQLRL